MSQKKDDLLQLPSGKGVLSTLDANQMLRIEMHYINPTNATMTLVSTTTMIPILDADYKYEAGFLFIGDIDDISSLPNSKTTLGPIFVWHRASTETRSFSRSPVMSTSSAPT